MTAPRRYWHELASPDFAGLDAERTVALLPVGADRAARAAFARDGRCLHQSRAS